MPILATTIFFFSFGIIQALGYDYHSNVMTAMLLPWFLYYLKKQRFALASLFVVLFVIGKENMSLWLFFIAIGLMWDYRKDRKTLWHLAAYALFSIAYFILINMVVMPKLGGSGGGFARYSYLGNSYGEIAKYLLSHPWEAIKILFTNTLGKPHYDGIKAEFYICALATGMILTLLKPNYLFMLLPLIGQKMLASDRMFWGVSLQYSVEFMPVLVISSFLVIIKIKKQWPRLVLACALLLSTILTTFYTIGVPKSYIMVDQLCVYQGRHYQQKDFDIDYARQLMEMIPDDASVCAGRMFVPHLALRPEIYDYYAVAPHVRADYVLIPDEYLEMTRGGKSLFYYRDEYEMLATDGSLTLFRRKKP